MKNKVNHNERMKALRPFVSFNYDLRKPLSPQSKAKINKYYKYVVETQQESAQTIVYRPRRKDHLQKAKNAAGTPRGLKDLKVAFVPTLGEETKITYNAQGEIKFKSKHVDKTFIEFDPIELVLPDAENYVRSIMDAHDFKTYAITFGEHLSPGYLKETAVEQVLKLATKYDVKGKKNYKNWLFGVEGLTFKKQADAGKYLKSRNEAATQRKRETVKLNKKKNLSDAEKAENRRIKRNLAQRKRRTTK